MKGITDIDEGTIRRIDWQELLPATLLIRTFSLTLKFVIICIISFCLSVTYSALPHSDAVKAGAETACSNLNTNTVSIEVLGFDIMKGPWSGDTLFSLKTLSFHSCWGYSVLIVSLALLMYLWLMLARSTAVRIASTSRSGFLDSLIFAWHTFPSLGGVILLCGLLVGIPFLLLQLLTLLKNGAFCSLFMPFHIILAFVFVFLTISVFFAFPMMLAAIATDKSDCFDAVARAFSYLFQRPFHYFIYMILAILLATVGYIFVNIVVQFTYWCLQFQFSAVGNKSPIGGSFWIQTLLHMPCAYLFVCKIVYSTSIYFILRRSVDGTPLDNYKSDHSHKPMRKLAPFLYDDKKLETKTNQNDNNTDSVTSTDNTSTDNTSTDNTNKDNTNKDNTSAGEESKSSESLSEQGKGSEQEKGQS